MKKEKGFTLLELLIVIAIIGALMALALPRYQNSANEAKTCADVSNIKAVNNLFEVYLVKKGFYPAGSPPTTSALTGFFTDLDFFPEGPPKDPLSAATGTNAYTAENKAGASGVIQRLFTHNGVHAAATGDCTFPY